MKSLACSAFLLSSLASTPAFAADVEDLYVEVLGGVRWSAPASVQGGFSFGYCPFDELGVGFAFDQIGSSELQFGAEVRWMIEPLEVHGSIGFQRRSDAVTGNASSSALFSLGGAYLVAVTSSMAAFADVKYQAVLQGKGSLFTGLGGRVLF